MNFGASNTTGSDCFRMELKVLKKLQHPNIIWLHEVIDDQDSSLYLVTEYYKNGSLGDEMRRLNFKPKSKSDKKLSKRGM